jgi:hypothetical protein
VQHLDNPSVPPTDARVDADRVVRDRRFLVEVTVLRFANAERVLGAQAFDLGERTRGEDAQDADSRGPSCIGLSSMMARWPATVPERSTSGTPQ